MDIRQQLNEKQYQAASSQSQYLRIIAGAGTGKTRTLSYRIAYLIQQGFIPRRMVAITFTNKAAKEMLNRIDGILKNEMEFVPDSKPLIVTFHGFCVRFLRKEIALVPGYTPKFTIASEEDQNAIYKSIFSKMTKGLSKEFTKEVIGKISSLKTDGVFVEELSRDNVRIPFDALYNFDELQHVYTSYQSYLKNENLLDFDDLLMLTVKVMEEHEDIRALWRRKYDIFLIDEFQDTNSLQYYLVKLFLSPSARLTVVGDPDQTIYTWRGAENRIIKDDLQRDFPSLETVVLDDNYRSTQNILDAANRLIKNNRDRMDKNLNAASKVIGDKVEYFRGADANNEAYSIATSINTLHRKFGMAYQDIAVIYRSNYLSNPIEKQLTMLRIPYEIYGGLKFYDRAEIKDAISYLRLALNPDEFSFKRILKAPNKGIGEKMIEKAEEMRASLGEEVNLMTVFRDYQQNLGLSKKQAENLEIFFQAFDRFFATYASDPKPSDIVTAIQQYFQETGFLAYVHQEDKKAQEKLSYTAASSTSKVDNVTELLATITDFFDHDVLEDDGSSHAPMLDDFLIEVALQSGQDEMKDTDKVALMTGHVSKGLEFPVVFVTGLNNAIFPTVHAMQAVGSKAIEEERRLLYVCMTRAKKKLYLSSFSGRNIRNGAPYEPSLFLRELQLLTPRREEKSYDAYRGSHRTPTSLFGTMSPNAAKVLGTSMTYQSSGEKETYRVGDRVVHVTFGKGDVIAVEGDKITVVFPEPYGQKKLMVGFKAFRRLKEGE